MPTARMRAPGKRDGIAVGKPKQIEPTRQPDRVLLREPPQEYLWTNRFVCLPVHHSSIGPEQVHGNTFPV